MFTRFLNNLSIKQKLWVLVSILSLSLVMVGFTAWTGFQSANHQTTATLDREMQQMSILKRVSDLYAVNVVDATHKAMSGEFELTDSAKSVSDSLATIAQDWEVLSGTGPAALDKKILEKLEPMRNTAEKTSNEILAALKAGDKKEVERIRTTEMYGAIDPFTGEVTIAYDAAIASAKSRGESLGKQLAASSVTVALVAIASMVIAGLFSSFLAGRLKKQFNEFEEQIDVLAKGDLYGIQSGIKSLSQGDLTRQVTISSEQFAVTSKDEIGQLGQSLNEMGNAIRETIQNYETARTDLNKMVLQIFGSSQAVSKSAVELSSQAQDINYAASSLNDVVGHVAQTAEETAYATNEIAGNAEKLASSAQRASISLESLAERVDQVSKGTKAQSEALEDTLQSMKQASSNVEQTLGAIEAIRTQVSVSSKNVSGLGQKGQQIGEIVQTIEEIAEQTNLLALNAAIEAARAGDAGRGFAVVADEVRKLAERAAESTRSISDLVASVQNDVVLAVDATGKTDAEIKRLEEQSHGLKESFTELSARLAEVGEIAEQNGAHVNAITDTSCTVSNEIASVSHATEETSETLCRIRERTESNAAAAEEMHASVNQQSSAIEVLERLTQEVAAVSDEMAATIQRFQVEKEDRSHHLRAA